ncbi:hypothetical protein [Treponema sp. J25]|uniref:hypothetical protein n=1 Tax=Treponema sp. J25 TaxID=2094121 RepID=UPI00104E5DFA|nr:hypothetical protein [Treponema sp. J25]TCW60256.1 hypothetical protein C5O22_12475 [Treponema sp. J25]
MFPLFYFFMCIPLLLLAESETEDLDTIVDTLIQNLGIEAPQTTSYNGSVYIKDIHIRINGTTKESWVRSRLFISKGQRFTEEQWKQISTQQADYFLETGLFYNANVYLIPSEEDGQFFCVIDLTDGFMYAFNFWPWDVSVAFRHLLNGNELLEVTLGTTTQYVRWSHPVVGGTPFSYKIGGGHLIREYHWREESYVAEGSLYASLGPWLDTGFETEVRYYILSGSIPFPIETQGSIAKLGFFADIWPVYRFMRPLGFNVQVAGGTVYGGGTQPAAYARSQVRLYVKPFSNLVGHWTIQGAAVDPYTSPLVWPDPSTFRSPVELDRRPIYLRTYFQTTLLSLLPISLGFSTMTLNPYIFIESAGTFERLNDISIQDMRVSSGTALAFGFSYPVGLYFSFGIKRAVYPDEGISFLFSVDTALY